MDISSIALTNMFASSPVDPVANVVAVDTNIVVAIGVWGPRMLPK